MTISEPLNSDFAKLEIIKLQKFWYKVGNTDYHFAVSTLKKNRCALMAEASYPRSRHMVHFQYTNGQKSEEKKVDIDKTS